MDHGSFEIKEFKALEGDEPQGLFAAIVSVFGNVDRNGDRVMPGAFTKTLERWRESTNPIPVVWSHEHKDPSAFIGSVDAADVKETSQGLVVAGKLDITENPKARQVFDLLKTGRLKQWSFAYSVTKERIAKDRARELMEVDLFEVGPTLVGANADALTLAVKEAGDTVTEQKLGLMVTEALSDFDGELDALIELKIGRAISAKTEKRIRAALAELGDILSSLDEAEPEEQKDSIPEVVEVIPTPPGEDELLRVGLAEAEVFLARRRNR